MIAACEAKVHSAHREFVFDDEATASEFCAIVEKNKMLLDSRQKTRLEITLGDIKLKKDEELALLFDQFSDLFGPFCLCQAEPVQPDLVIDDGPLKALVAVSRLSKYSVLVCCPAADCDELWPQLAHGLIEELEILFADCFDKASLKAIL